MMARQFDTIDHLPFAKGHHMLILTALPAFITTVFRAMPGVWKGQHRLLLCWLIVLHAGSPGRKTLEELHRWSPAALTAWRCRRLLNATSWSVHLLIAWVAHDVMARLPPAPDGIRSGVGAGSHKPQRAHKNPLAQKGRQSHHHPWSCGIRFALLLVAWDVSRLPVACRIILPKTHPAYRTAKALFREMLRQCKPPAWAELVIVAGDAASSSKVNLKLVQQRHQTDRARAWYFVFAISRTWKTVDDKAIKNLVQHLPRCRYHRTWIPRLATWQKRQASWGYAPRLCLRAIGDVTLVLSKKGRTVSPAHTQRLVTTLPHVTARQVLWRSQNRWSVERVPRDLQAALGLGDHQGRGGHDRLEKSFGLALLASLVVLRVCHQEISPGHPWSVSQLQHSLRLRVITHQVAHNVKVKRAARRKAA